MAINRRQGVIVSHHCLTEGTIIEVTKKNRKRINTLSLQKMKKKL